MSNIYNGSTLSYFQVPHRDWVLLQTCSKHTANLYLALANRMQRYSSSHITWTTEQQMAEAGLSRKQLIKARKELSAKGIVSASEVKGCKGVWLFRVSVPSKILDLDTITPEEARAYYSQYLPEDAIETDCGLQCDCPLHTKPTSTDKKNGKVYTKGKRTFSVELRRSESGIVGWWWCHCYGEYTAGRTIEFEQRKKGVIPKVAHKSVTGFFLALRDKQKALRAEQQESEMKRRHTARKPYQPNRVEEEENVIPAAF